MPPDFLARRHMLLSLLTEGFRYATVGRYTQHSISIPAPAGSAAHAHGGACRSVAADRLLVQRVDGLEVPEIGEEHPYLRDVGPLGLAVGKDSAHVRKRLPVPAPPPRRRRASRWPDRSRAARRARASRPLAPPANRAPATGGALGVGTGCTLTAWARPREWDRASTSPPREENRQPPPGPRCGPCRESRCRGP